MKNQFLFSFIKMFFLSSLIKQPNNGQLTKSWIVRIFKDFPRLKWITITYGLFMKTQLTDCSLFIYIPNLKLRILN